MLSAQRNETETKQFQKCCEMFRFSQNKRKNSCFRQSQSVSAVYAKLLSIVLSNFSQQRWRSSYALL